jgi:hypothetical protein
MTLARWLCALACIAVLSACKGGDDDDSASGGSSAKDAGRSDDHDGSGSSGKGGSGAKGGSSASGDGGKDGGSASGDGGEVDRDASTEVMSDASSETGGKSGASGGTGGTSGSTSIGAIEHDPNKCGGSTCPEPSVCDRESDPPACRCPEGYHYVDVGGGASPCAIDCEGDDCDAGS